MAFDGAFLYAVRNEAEILIDGRVDKIHQPSREEIIISFRTRQGIKKLYISTNTGCARVHLTENPYDNPQTPPMFCMLMRKILTGSRLADIRQEGLERVLFLDFDCVNELGDKVIITLAVEIIGRCSNLVIINEDGCVIDCIKRVTADMSQQRPVLPGMKYVMPPRRERLNFLECGDGDIRAAVAGSGETEFSKVIIDRFEGISPVLAREWTFFAGRGEYIRGADITPGQLDRLCFIIKDTAERLRSGDLHFTAVSDKNGLLKDFSFIRLSQFGNLMYTKEYDSACSLLDSFYHERDISLRMKQRANDLFRLLMNLTDRITRRIANQKNELLECADRDRYRLYGDLVSANIYKIKKGDTSVETENFYDEDHPLIKIPLDASKTPSQNVQYYYNEYKKMVTAEKMLTVRIKKGEEELEYIESVFDSLTRATTGNDIAQLREELTEQGYIRNSRRKGKVPKALPPMEYHSSDGYTILVGRNNIQNDRLSLKLAEKNDIWLHAQSVTGSHVLILTEGETPPDRTIEEAAVIAAVNSRGRDSNLVPVDYCLAKYVKKPAGAKPGKVIFSNYSTAFVKPDAELEKRLRAAQ